MSEEIRTEFIKKFREETATKDEKEMNKEKEGLSEETIREIGQHLKSVSSRLNDALIAGLSMEKIEKINQELESISEARKQLALGKPGKEILHIILDFPTETERKAQYSLDCIFKVAQLNPDGEKSVEKQKLGLEKYIEEECEKRKMWVEQLQESFGEKNNF